MTEPILARRLRAGDTVAVLSTSWGGPSVFPHVFDAGLEVLHDRFALRVREYPCTRRHPGDLRADPRARADDVNAALADPEVRAVLMSIGGDDSARILDHLDLDLAVADPKIVMGYSDSVTQLLALHTTGLVTFHGPAVMAGFAQLGHFPEAETHVRTMLFDAPAALRYEPFPRWSNGYLDWNEGHATEPAALHDSSGARWLQGSGVARGRWWGGCVEVLEFLKGTRWWPSEHEWDDRVLFLETSEDVPSPQQVRYCLFGYGLQGVFDRIAALVIGRARGYSAEMSDELDRHVSEVLAEFGATDLTVVTNVDIGHTDPQWIVPIGGTVELDAEERTITLVGSVLR